MRNGRASRFPILVFAVLSLQACALNFQNHQDQMNEMMSRSVGRDINDVIGTLGPPQRLMPAPGGEGKIYVWTEEHARTIAGRSTSQTRAQGNTYGDQFNGQATTETTYVPPQTQGWTAYVMFWADSDGIIYRWAWRGI